jgi:thymidylate synthase (FAD)
MGRICYQSSHRVEKCKGYPGEGCVEGRIHCVSGKPSFEICEACNGTGTDKESAIKFVKMILARGHESVIEHASASFSVVCDRGVSHEMVRQRLCSFSQESTRFCSYIKETFGHVIKVIEPPWVGIHEDQVLAHQIWARTVDACEQGYFDLLEKAHQTPELARSVLQNCLKTEVGMTANFREWRTVMKQRSSVNMKAHPQMREVADMILKELKRISPVCFEDIAV